MEDGLEFVATVGTIKMPLWFVGSWDFLLLVHVYILCALIYVISCNYYFVDDCYSSSSTYIMPMCDHEAHYNFSLHDSMISYVEHHSFRLASLYFEYA